jgi:hypothetical protein
MDAAVIYTFLAAAVPVSTIGITLIAKAVTLKNRVDAHEALDVVVHAGQHERLGRIEAKLDLLTDKLIPQASVHPK